jgi:hypothetical protein
LTWFHRDVDADIGNNKPFLNRVKREREREMGSVAPLVLKFEVSDDSRAGYHRIGYVHAQTRAAGFLVEPTPDPTRAYRRRRRDIFL